MVAHFDSHFPWSEAGLNQSGRDEPRFLASGLKKIVRMVERTVADTCTRIVCTRAACCRCGHDQYRHRFLEIGDELSMRPGDRVQADVAREEGSQSPSRATAQCTSAAVPAGGWWHSLRRPAPRHTSGNAKRFSTVVAGLALHAAHAHPYASLVNRLRKWMVLKHIGPLSKSIGSRRVEQVSGYRVTG